MDDKFATELRDINARFEASDDEGEHKALAKEAMNSVARELIRRMFRNLKIADMLATRRTIQ